MAAQFSVKFMRLLLLSNFISQNPNYRGHEKFAIGITVALAIVLLFGNFIGFLNLENAAESGPLMLFTTIILQNLATFWIMRIHRDTLKCYMESLDSPDATNIETNRLFRKLMRKLLTYFYTCYVILIIGSLVNTLTNTDYENNMRYVAPFWFYCAKKNTSSLAISRICLRTNKAVDYIVLNCVIYVLNIFLHIPYIMSIGFFSLILQFKKAHRLFILNSIEDISTSIERIKSTQDNRRTNTICKEFENVIRQYQWLHS